MREFRQIAKVFEAVSFVATSGVLDLAPGILFSGPDVEVSVIPLNCIVPQLSLCFGRPSDGGTQ